MTLRKTEAPLSLSQACCMVRTSFASLPFATSFTQACMFIHSHTHSHTKAVFVNHKSQPKNEELAPVLSTLISNNLFHYSPHHQRNQVHQQLNWLICFFFNQIACSLEKSPALAIAYTAFDQFRGSPFFAHSFPEFPHCFSCIPSCIHSFWSGAFSLLSMEFKFTFLINPLPLWHILVEDLFLIPIKYKLLNSSQGTQTHLQNSAILSSLSYQ